jgi:hypothetical protein
MKLLFPSLMIAGLIQLPMARAQETRCDPPGISDPVRFLTADAYAEKVLSRQDLEHLIGSSGSLPGFVRSPWVWWDEAKIASHCSVKKNRGRMNKRVCIVYAQHQNAFAALLTLVSQMTNAQQRVVDQKKTCTHPADSVIDSNAANVYWRCLGGIQFPSSVALSFKFDGGLLTNIRVTGSFLRETPAIEIAASWAGAACGRSGAWLVHQPSPVCGYTCDTRELTSIDDVGWTPTPAPASSHGP